MIFVQPTEEEKASVTTLKQELTAAACTHPFTDVTVLRFLRGRKHVMDKALNGLIKHVEWREEFHVDTIVTDTSSFTKEITQRKCIVSGFDKLGRPILYIVARNHDKNQRNLDELRSFIIHTIENTMKHTKPVDEKIMIVFDLTKFTLACMDYDAVKLIVNILQYNYPETLSVGLILNAPMLFSACWAVIKPWLDPVTAAKCVFIKTAQLGEYIDADQIPNEIVDTGKKSGASSTHSLAGMDASGGGSGASGMNTAAKPAVSTESGDTKPSSTASASSTSIPAKNSTTSATSTSEASTGEDTPSDTTVFNTTKMAAAIDTVSRTTTTPTSASASAPLPLNTISSTTKITTVATKLEG